MAIIVPEEIKKILSSFEERKDAFRESELHDALRRASNTQEISQDLKNGYWVESAAFNFSELSVAESSEWGTYFGPMSGISYADGTKINIPDIKEIDQEVIDYWKKRAHETQHPVCRARYSDLVWEFTYPVTFQKAELIYAQMAIDSYVAIVELIPEETQMQCRRHLERALKLSISLNDKTRIESVKKAMFRLHDQIAEPRKIGSWTFLFDSLYDNKKVPLTDGERSKMVSSLEEMLRLSSDPAAKNNFDPWGAQAASQRLEKHYKKINKPQEAKEAILTAGKAFESIAQQADPLLAMFWLQDVYEKYKDRGFKDDALRVQKQSKEKGANVKDSMKEIVTTVQIPKEELDRFFKDLTSGNLNTALHKIAINFTPQIDKIQKSLEELRKDHPLQALIGVTTIGDANFIARAGSVEDDPEGRLRLELSQRISVSTLFLSTVLEKLKEHYSPNAAQLTDHLYQAPLFDPERRDLILDGIEAYLANDHVKTIHVLVPQIEYIFRRLLSLLDLPTNKSAGKGIMQEKNINEALADLAVKNVFSEDMRLYFLVSLAEKKGLNIRHRVSHGLMKRADFNQRISDLIINILLCLATIKEIPSPEISEKDEPKT
ncbi:MAG: DUF4209 domain-containing protein [Deltaproteobacteria bacterium]|nr:MAG: DUF4209 domain-containing protein [Deltaproteobacteria bacterium]